MTHQATVLVRCVDVRYSKDGTRQSLPEAYDFTYPGAALGLVNDPTWRANLFAQWEILTTLGITIGKIIITDHYSAQGNHSGCKAYERDDSRERHERNLHVAAQLIQAQPRFRAIPVQLYLQDLDAGTLEEVK